MSSRLALQSTMYCMTVGTPAIHRWINGLCKRFNSYRSALEFMLVINGVPTYLPTKSN